MCSAREHDSHFNGIFSFDGCNVLTMFWLIMILFCHWSFQYHCNRFLFTFYWKFYGISWIQSYSISSNFNNEEETQLKIFCNFFFLIFAEHYKTDGDYARPSIIIIFFRNIYMYRMRREWKRVKDAMNGRCAHNFCKIRKRTELQSNWCLFQLLCNFLIRFSFFIMKLATHNYYWKPSWWQKSFLIYYPSQNWERKHKTSVQFTRRKKNLLSDESCKYSVAKNSIWLLKILYCIYWKCISHE